MKNHYKILEIRPDASLKEIKEAYRRLSKKYHPDLNEEGKYSEDYFQSIHQAYLILKDSKRREAFDESLRRSGLNRSFFSYIKYYLKNKAVYRSNFKTWIAAAIGWYNFKHSRRKKRYYKGVAVVFIAVLALSMILFVESRIDDHGRLDEVFELANPFPDPSEDRSEKNHENSELIGKNGTSGNKELSSEKKQNDQSEPEADQVFTNVEKKPVFTGGPAAYEQYLKDNLHYPAPASKQGLHGKVLVSFIVERDGNISGVSVIRGIGGGCDEEAVRLLKTSPPWVPGERGGKKVRVRCIVPVRF